MSESKIWVTADLHLGHEKLAFERGFNSTHDHTVGILGNIRALVKPKDTLIVLGDLAFGDDKEATIKQLLALGCHLRLVAGNHDNLKPWHWDVFNTIEAYRVVGDALLSHMPVHELQFDRWRINIHGHLHDKSLSDPRYKCVSLEQNGLKPFLLKDLL